MVPLIRNTGRVSRVHLGPAPLQLRALEVDVDLLAGAVDGMNWYRLPAAVGVSIPLAWGADREEELSAARQRPFYPNGDGPRDARWVATADAARTTAWRIAAQVGALPRGVHVAAEGVRVERDCPAPLDRLVLMWEADPSKPATGLQHEVCHAEMYVDREHNTVVWSFVRPSRPDLLIQAGIEMPTPARAPWWMRFTEPWRLK